MKVNRFNTDNDSRHDRLVTILTNAKEAGVDVELAFAEVQEKERYNTFQARGLRKSKIRQPDLCHLLGIKPNKEKRLLPYGCDHPSLWVDENDVPQALVFQPYQLSYEEIVKNIELCESLSLKMKFNSKGSWHYAGKTLLVEITKKGANKNEK
jgi:hypothetical protein